MTEASTSSTNETVAWRDGTTTTLGALRGAVAEHAARLLATLGRPSTASERKHAWEAGVAVLTPETATERLNAEAASFAGERLGAATVATAR